MMKKGDLYKGFRVIETVDNVKDCDAPGIWLRHEKTGMEVFHVLKDDEENLFALSFRTPTKDSTGVAHIMEHSVLCGSERYPLKDPFIRLSNQSVATYLNAFTTADYTSFPSSSIVKADYFNIFSVYADAVFFPLLREEVFLQEGHRYEFDEKGNPQIQGVVYNEMKGKYSSYESVVSGEIDNVTFAGTRYTNDAGGDPMEIPNLTYKEFKAFHKKYYTPANCLVFLYGNIPTEEQLDFLDSNVLSKIKVNGRKVKYSSCTTDSRIARKVHVYGPANENEVKDSVVCAWKLDFPELPRNEVRIELTFLNNLLWSSDSAPVAKDLMDSGLGEDMAPQTGMTISLQCQNAVCGLRGVDAKNADKVKQVIFGSLDRICREGLSSKLMDRICMTFDFYNREISRSGGPQGFVMMRRCMRGWVYGENPGSSLELFNDFSKLKSKLLKNPEYLSEMIHRYFLDNDNYSVITASPSIQWIKKRARQEKENIRAGLAALTKEKAVSKYKKMIAFQEKKEGEEEDKLIPRLTIDQLDTKVSIPRTVESDINGVQFFTNTEPTNGIVYFDLCFTMDNLSAEEYKYASIVAGTCTDVGWGKISWSEGLDMQQCLTGTLGVHTECMVFPGIKKDKPLANHVGRDWFMASFSVLEDKFKESLDLLSDILLNADYSDTHRLMDLINSSVNSDKSSFAAYASQYAFSRSKRDSSRNALLKEIWSGLTSVYTVNELSKKDPALVGKKLNRILKKILRNGSVLHVISTRNGIKLAKKYLPDFVSKMNLHRVEERPEISDSALSKITELPCEIVNKRSTGTDFVDEVVLINGTVGTVYKAMPSIEYGDPLCVSESVFCHSMANNELWDEVRMKGGAYGVSFSVSAVSGFSFYGTYRDPKPFESARNIKETLRRAKEHVYTKDEVEKAIIGRYSSIMEPTVPFERGAMSFISMLQGRDLDELRKSIKRLFALKPKDIQKVARIYGEKIDLEDKRFLTVIFCPKELFLPKNRENTGKIIALPL